MFTRRVIMRIEANSAAEFTRIIEGQFLPQLRGQKGCRHVDSFVTPVLSEAVVNSYWDTEEYAGAYDRVVYREGLKALADVVEGVPQVEAFHISSSTFHKITASRREAYKTSQLMRG